MTAGPTRRPRLPFVLLGLMTAFSFGGPLLIGYVLKGGASPNWPPDRLIEWAVFVGVSGMVLVLMLACLSLALVGHKAIRAARPPSANPSSSPLPLGEGGGSSTPIVGVEQ